LEGLESRQLLATIVVNSTLDFGTPQSPTDPDLTLREAIAFSNGTLSYSSLSPAQQALITLPLATPPAANTINFNIPTSDPGYIPANQTWRIAPGSALPVITAPVTINGYSQTGALANTNGPGLADNAVLKIQIIPTTGPVFAGLQILATNTTIEGLVINNFNLDGINLRGNTGGDTISGDFIEGNGGGGGNGITINSPNNTIGGPTPAARNVIGASLADPSASHTGSGIAVNLDTNAVNITGNLIENNFIGVGADGISNLGNANDGIDLYQATNETIGGTSAADANVISGNLQSQIAVLGTVLVNQDELIQGNYLGTDVTGTKVPTGSTNHYGISVNGSAVTIGGTATGAGNIIAQSQDAGIALSGANNLVQGNWIGTNPQGSAALGLPTAIQVNGSGDTIGGAAAGAANIITNYVERGIYSTGVTFLLISHNSIFSSESAGAGISLLSDDNGSIQAPVLTSATANPDGSVTVQGTLTEPLSGTGTYTLEFFASQVAGNGQGQTFLNPAVQVPIPDTGTHQFEVKFNSGLPAGQSFITATATDPNNATSEFSNALSPSSPTTTPTTTNLSPQTVNITTDESATFTAVVTPNSGTGIPTGNVVFDLNNVAQPPVALQTVAGQAEAVLPLSGLAVGQYSITATYQGGGNFAASPVSNTATLNVSSPVNPLIPTTTTLSPTSATITTAQSAQFTAVVTANSTSTEVTPTGEVIFDLDGTPLPPVTLQVVNSMDQAVVTVSGLSAGQHSLVATYQGDPNFKMSPPSNTATIQVNPVSVIPPTVQSVERYGFHAQPTTLVLGFSTALDPNPAENVHNYQIVGVARASRHGTLFGPAIPVGRAVYNAESDSVTLYPTRRLDVHQHYQLTVNGTPPNGLTGSTGTPLDGLGNGSPGTNFVTLITRANLAGSSTEGFRAANRPMPKALSAASGRLTVHSMAARNLALARHAR
jgi:hypothetical protein